ncbi:MAG: hypothetical protein M3P18_21915 [Actinomycetota bacterium]|nr:hypothetical protein [Actinomycetota bacterium]
MLVRSVCPRVALGGDDERFGHAMMRAILRLAALVTVATACSAPPAITPAASSQTAVASAGSTAAGSTGTANPVGAGALSPNSVASWSGPEIFLLSGVRRDLRSDCAPTRKLPSNADAGIECKPPGPAGLVGFYRFNDHLVMNRIYFARLLQYGVKQETGRLCEDGKPGEGIDVPGVEGFEQRIGCYIDETGAANLRVAIPSDRPNDSVYVGVVGRSGDIKALVDWVNNRPPGAVGCGYCIDLWQSPLDVAQ